MNLTPEMTARVAILLGREPRGLEDVAITSPEGEPMVIRVASLVDGKPFPTLFWLIDPALCYRIDRAEAAGLIAQLQSRIDAEPALREGMQEDHRAYIQLREAYLSAALRQKIEALGYLPVLREKGIGGIADYTRIRCLHTWYGAHLVVPNTVGRLLDQWWAEPAL